ncbi:GntR family transcriptional regulator [Nocardia sp. NPDC005366]|uniref:FadR/GntR family transcriptional regulator n=1 Tax=Nocardia sp. NPDC005366 TaxID=3156878 RepID=UPI00339F552B
MADKVRAPIFDARNAASRPIRTPKTAQLVARNLRRMIIDGSLKDGDHLPHEAELMLHYSVSRPTLREAVRVLESERLVEVRRGSRSGARVCVPGPEIVARPASLLLELSGATVADVFVAREAIEPDVARILADEGTDEDFDELERLVDEEIPAAFASDNLAAGTSAFHLRMVQLSGNATLAIIAGMLHEITERHTEAVILETRADKEFYESSYKLEIRSCRRLIKLLRARDADGAFEHWKKHMVNARLSLMKGRENVQVRDILE